MAVADRLALWWENYCQSASDTKSKRPYGRGRFAEFWTGTAAFPAGGGIPARRDRCCCSGCSPTAAGKGR